MVVMKVTVEEIAKIAGVSKATVSRVLNHSATGVGEETRRRVQAVIDEMNYSVNSAGTHMYSKSIALMIPDITNPFFADIARAVERRAALDNYIVILANTDFSEEKERSYLANLVAKKVDGIILVSCGSKCQREHFMPEKYRIPMVLLDRKLEGCNCFGVYADNEYVTFRACEALINNGSKDIAFISGSIGTFTSLERLNGYKDALKQYGIAFNPELIKKGNYTMESGYEAVLELERAGICYSAIIAANDMMALGALKALKELSYQVPERIELIGFDNISFSQYCEPPLSTIQQPTTEMGKQAVEALLKMIKGESVSGSIRLQPKILFRKTTK